MKILFSNPPWWAETTKAVTSNGAVVDFYRMGVRAGSRWPFTMQTCLPPDRYEPGMVGQLYLPYPFFLGYAATYAAKQTGADVRFRDSIALHESYDSYFRYLEEQRFEMIVIESASPSWEHDRNLIRTLSQRFPGTRFVVTGPIASSAASILEECPDVIAVLRGEYEKGVVKVINGARGIIDFDLLTVEEMNEAPFPWFDDLHALRYCDTNPRGQRLPHAHVWSSRGCPFKCIFCVWPATMTGNDPDGTGKRTVRHYTPEYMEIYLSQIVEKYKFKSIYFDDDTFNLGDRHVENMCRVMRRIGVPWSAMCRSDSSRMDLWKEMRDSGCFGVKLGFESGNQWVVDNIVNKRLDLEHARVVVRHLRELGMTVHGTFTFGLPGETPEQMRDTEQYIQSLGLNSLQKSGCAEIEGTPLHTLSEGGSLSGYDGATIDGNYLREQDGARKLEKINGPDGSGSIYEKHPACACTEAENEGQTRAGARIPGGEISLDAVEWHQGTGGIRTEPVYPDPTTIFRVAPQDSPRCERLMALVPGYSGVASYRFFRTLIVEFGVRSILMLGVYQGRDISFMLDIAGIHGIALRIVGIDKFSDDFCLDWPENLRHLSWREAGFGDPPSLEAVSRNLESVGFGASKVELMVGRDEYYLAGKADSFDLIYLDTSHDYETVKRQIDMSRRFLSRGGFLAGGEALDHCAWGVSRALGDSLDGHWSIGHGLWLSRPGALSAEHQDRGKPATAERDLKPRKFWYLDPGLSGNLGHHANSCRAIIAETQVRGIPTSVFSNAAIEPALHAELQATPWFRCSTYGKYSDDPICGWLQNYERIWQCTVEDLQRLNDFSREDLFYMNSVLPAQFRALVQWVKSIPIDERPQVIMEFGTDPGLSLTGWKDDIPCFEPRDPRLDSRAMLYRHAADLLTPADRPFVHLATFDSRSSEAYRFLLNGYHVATLPLPQRAVTDCHSRVGKRPLVVAFLGHQRGEKGYLLVPEVVDSLLKSVADIQVLVHNGWPEGWGQIQSLLRRMASADSRLILNETSADDSLWAKLLNTSDLIVCPYMPDRFVAAYSAVASEAIANAIPLVVPARTTLERVVQEFGNPGTIIESYEARSVVEAVLAAIREYDELAARADAAARKWEETRGVRRLVEAMLLMRNAYA